MLRRRLRLLFALLLPAGYVHAQLVVSDFGINADGWTAYTHADPSTSVAYSASGGTSGGGAIILQEPANGANDYFVAPAKFTGNLSAYYHGSLSFDLKLNPAWDNSTDSAMVVLTGTYNSSPLSIGYVNELAMHYGTLARESVHRLIREKREISFDEAYAVGMRFPTVQLTPLRAWIDEVADVVNLGAREKVAKPGVGHRVTIRDGSGAPGEFKF